MFIAWSIDAPMVAAIKGHPAPPTVATCARKLFLVLCHVPMTSWRGKRDDPESSGTSSSNRGPLLVISFEALGCGASENPSLEHAVSSRAGSKQRCARTATPA